MTEKSKVPQSTILKNWIPFSREVASAYKNGLISRAEHLLYLVIREQCNPYGIATVHLESIRDDVFGSRGSKKTVSVNYVNQLLLSLRSKRFLYFKDRTGRKGSFEIRFGDMVSPDGRYISIGHFFKEPITSEEVLASYPINTEVTSSSWVEKQRLKKANNSSTKTIYLLGAKNKNRGYNNDIDIENVKDNTDVSESIKEGAKPEERTEKPYSCRVPIVGYTPSSFEETTAKEIASSVGDNCMDRYLALIREGRFGLLEKAYGEFKEVDLDGVDNRGGYLNKIITRLINEQLAKKMKV